MAGDKWKHSCYKHKPEIFFAHTAVDMKHEILLVLLVALHLECLIMRPLQPRPWSQLSNFNGLHAETYLYDLRPDMDFSKITRIESESSFTTSLFRHPQLFETCFHQTCDSTMSNFYIFDFNLCQMTLDWTWTSNVALKIALINRMKFWNCNLGFRCEREVEMGCETYVRLHIKVNKKCGTHAETIVGESGKVLGSLSPSHLSDAAS